MSADRKGVPFSHLRVTREATGVADVAGMSCRFRTASICPEASSQPIGRLALKLARLPPNSRNRLGAWARLRWSSLVGRRSFHVIGPNFSRACFCTYQICNL